MATCLVFGANVMFGSSWSVAPRKFILHQVRRFSTVEPLETTSTVTEKLSVTPELIKKTAGLAQLDVTDEEVERLRPRIESFLGFIAEMEQVDTSGITPMLEVKDAFSVLREDSLKQFDNQDGILDNMPHEQDCYLSVPKVGEEES
eukprot:CAMPEP_0113935760 /NCGR_PEP_ID=MMETSP1339-20121228/2845_1 /TAXON_ID=94617 /ORGANISM="Fibrocapsa japonica" /LENGTH=145 /DNA_ID=CAMNT_0000938017 /DNA_START=112 /DNA_END=552 /DNA_ORIENTATION=- /assembly_acc=CAM_ASM_000762